MTIMMMMGLPQCHVKYFLLYLTFQSAGRLQLRCLRLSVRSSELYSSQSRFQHALLI